MQRAGGEQSFLLTIVVFGTVNKLSVHVHVDPGFIRSEVGGRIFFGIFELFPPYCNWFNFYA